MACEEGAEANINSNSRDKGGFGHTHQCHSRLDFTDFLSDCGQTPVLLIHPGRLMLVLGGLCCAGVLGAFVRITSYATVNGSGDPASNRDERLTPEWS